MSYNPLVLALSRLLGLASAQHASPNGRSRNSTSSAWRNSRKATNTGKINGSSHRPSARVTFRSYVAFHGTPSVANARSILRDGWMAGAGNAHGDGVYLTLDRSVATGYASSSGVLLRCRVSGRTCEWGAHLDSLYNQWCQRRGATPNNSAKTAFLLERGVQVLRADNILVVLQPQYANPTAYKRKLRCVKVLGVHRASDGKPVRV